MATRGTAAWLIDEVDAYVGANVAAATSLGYAQAGYDTFLQGFDPRDSTVHVWGFLTPVSELYMSASVEGTVSGVWASSVSGEQLGTLGLTATTEIFLATHAGLYLTVEDRGTYRITTFTSTTAVTAQVLIGQTTGSFTSKSAWLAGMYPLPSNFGGLVEPFTSFYSSDYSTPIIEVADPNTIMGMWRDDNDENEACYYAIGPRFEAETAEQEYILYVAPRTENLRTWRYRYLRLPTILSDSASVYLLGGPQHYETIRACALAKAEEGTGRTTGVMKTLADVAMAGSIERDRLVGETHGPVSLADADTGISRAY